jgi:hypothetical protein
MNKSTSRISRARVRLALRAVVGAWKWWREPVLVRRTKYPLAVCAIFREEAAFLDEWLTFHAGIGVTHFYLYNNFSTDNFREVLRPWQAAGFVTLTDWPVEVGQIPAYQDCLRRFKNHARWIAFIDLDEFLFAPGSGNVFPVLDSLAHLPGLEVWHVYFGSNGHVKRPATPVIESYTSCATAATTTVKTIANPRLVYKPGIHQFKYWTGNGLDTSRQVPGSSVTPVFDRLRINHYWSRSLEDLAVKIQRGDATTVSPRGHGWHHEFERKLNEHSDFVIQPVARAIRKPLALEKPSGMDIPSRSPAGLGA